MGFIGKILCCHVHEKRSRPHREKKGKIHTLFSGILGCFRGEQFVEENVRQIKSNATMDEPSQLGPPDSVKAYTVEIIPSPALDSPLPSPRGSNVEEDGYFTAPMEFSDDEDGEEEDEAEKEDHEEECVNMLMFPSHDEEENGDDGDDDKKKGVEEEEKEKEEKCMTLLEFPDDDDDEKDDYKKKEGEEEVAAAVLDKEEPSQLGPPDSIEAYTIEIIPSVALGSPLPSPRGSNVEEDGYFTVLTEFSDDEDGEEEEEYEKEDEEEEGVNMLRFPIHDEEKNGDDDDDDDYDEDKKEEEEEEVAAAVVDKEEGIKWWDEVEEGDMEEEFQLPLTLMKDDEQLILVNDDDSEVGWEKKKANYEEKVEEEEEGCMDLLELPNKDKEKEDSKWWEEVEEGDMQEELNLLVTLMKDDGKLSLVDDHGEEGVTEKVEEDMKLRILLEEEFSEEEEGNKLKLVKWLGSGSTGTVYQAQFGTSGCNFAIKVMDKASLDQEDGFKRAETERMVLQLIDHPFLPTLYNCFETKSLFGLIMDFCSGGDLFGLKEQQPGGHFSENATRFYAAEVLLALEHLHAKGIIHRDLKLENILIRDDGHLMLTDFDLALVDPLVSSRFAEALETPLNLAAEPTVRSMSFVGTLEYLAPEIITESSHGSSVDWWTVGILLYNLMFGETPFKGENERLTMDNVVNKELTFPETIQSSEASKDLIRSLLVKEPQDRLGAKRGVSEIKEHPFFQGMDWE